MELSQALYVFFVLELGLNVCIGRLQQAALVLNASRRFRYTLDLKKEEEKEQRRRMIRAHAQVIRVCFVFLTYYLMTDGDCYTFFF